jgi:hypothetical protein
MFEPIVVKLGMETMPYEALSISHLANNSLL